MMKNLFLTLSVLLVGLLSSCDKCKDANCLNGATCNKGNCECTDFYSGDKCADEVRASYNAKYAGTFTYSDGSTDQDTLEFRSMGTDVTKLEVVDGETMVLTLTNATNYKITAEFIDGVEVYTLSGTGNFSSTATSLTGKTEHRLNGKLIESETFSFDGTKL